MAKLVKPHKLFTSEENWKHVKQNPLYAVSDRGRVWSWRSGRYLRIFYDKDGYAKVTLYGHVRVCIHVARLVLCAFLRIPGEGEQACHANGIPGDDRLCNLRWDTAQNNSRDKHIHGTMSRGAVHGMAKLSDKDVLEIRKSSDTQNKLAKRYGVTQQMISCIVNGKSWRHLNG